MENKKPYLHPAAALAAGLKPEISNSQKEFYISDGAKRAAGLPVKPTYADLKRIEADKVKPAQSDWDKRQSEFIERMEGYKKEEAALAEKHKAAEKDWDAIHAELEKKANADFDARKKKRDEEFEKNWGKK